MKTLRAAVLIIISMSSAAVSSQEAVYIKESLSQVTHLYRRYKHGQKEMALVLCAGEVFDYWFKSYENIIPAYLLDQAKELDEYITAKNLSLAHKGDLNAIYARYRPNIVSATRLHLAQLRLAGKIPDLPGPMDLDRAFVRELETNLKVCANPGFIEYIYQQAPLPSGLNMNERLSWTGSQVGTGSTTELRFAVDKNVDLPERFRERVRLRRYNTHFTFEQWLEIIGTR